MLLPVFFKIDTLFLGDLRFVGLWPRRPHVDPPLEISDYGVRQLAFRWHLEGLLLVQHRAVKQARIGLPGNDRWPGFATLKRPLAVVEVQFRLQFFGLCAVALIAMLRQHGTDFVFKELHLFRRRFVGGDGDERPEKGA